MRAARLHGAREIRLDEVSAPGSPAEGEVLLRVRAVGLCGSDLHMFKDARIGDTEFSSPLVLGHEFMGEVAALGGGALGGDYQPLQVGQRVAVDPAVPKERHELFEKGHPNLVPERFYGLYPDNGALQEYMHVKAKNCFPVSDDISDGAGTLLETLGVALHAVDLGHLKLADTVAVIGCGPVGLLILKLAQLSGARAVYACDKFSWRVEKARAWGAADAWRHESQEASVERLEQLTDGRGADVVFEAAWAEDSVNMAAELARLGGRLVLVGIPGQDKFTMKHSTARRKGLSIMFSRRMKHTYPRAIALASSGQIVLDELVSHTFSLDDTPKAFRLNAAYEDGVLKAVVHTT